MIDVCVLPALSLDNQQGSDSHFCRFNLQFSKANHLSPISASFCKDVQGNLLFTPAEGISFSTTHERFSQLRMKIKQVRQSVLSAILNLAGEVRLHFGGNATPFVQRGRIAQENSSMLHHSSGEHE